MDDGGLRVRLIAAGILGGDLWVLTAAGILGGDLRVLTAARVKALVREWDGRGRNFAGTETAGSQ